MHIIQFFIVGFAFFALTRAILRFKEARLSLVGLLFWLFFWPAVGFAALAPQTTSVLARLLGVGRGVDAVVYLSIVALFYVVFRVFLRLEELEHSITRLVREKALSERDLDV